MNIAHQVVSERASGSARRERKIQWLLASWIVTPLVLWLVMSRYERRVGAELLLVGCLWPVPVALLMRDLRLAAGTFIWRGIFPTILFPFSVWAGFGLLVNAQPLEPLVHLVMVSVVFAICHAFVRTLDVDALKRSFHLMALLGSVIYLAYWISSVTIGGRWIGRASGTYNPNSLALIGLFLLVVAWWVRPRLLMVVVWCGAFYVLYVTNSRTVMVGSLVFLIVLGIQECRAHPRLLPMWLLGGLLAAMVLSSSPGRQHVAAYARLDDRHPGIRTGLSGRMEHWEMGWEEFLESPITGNGYRSLRSVHNGYLELLASTGILGAALMLSLFAVSLAALAHNYRNASARWAAAVIAAYLVFCIAEPYLINIGNPLSVLVLLLIAQAWPQRRRRGLSVRVPRTFARHRLPQSNVISRSGDHVTLLGTRT